jgi:2-dehydro-3-deoxyphosphogluconate aldolase/(4S)-4-hydroxy-2-oxoglutarate aldolase
MSSTRVLDVIRADRAVALVRLDDIPDAAALAEALVAGGIHAIEFAFTNALVPEQLADVRSANASRGSGGDAPIAGAGTVLTAAQAESAIAAGAQFLVTPGLAPDVARVAADARVPVLMGAMTPSEVMRAVDLGAAAVKVFPAQTVGSAYFRHLRGPFPDVPLIASGGLSAGNSLEFLEAGAIAVTAGSSVIASADVSAQDWASVTSRARGFVDAFSAGGAS